MFSTETSIEERIFSGSNYNFLVLSRVGVKSFTSDLPYIIISVTDPENAEAENNRIEKPEGCFTIGISRCWKTTATI